jgi:predicted nucleotide-binding protein
MLLRKQNILHDLLGEDLNKKVINGHKEEKKMKVFIVHGHDGEVKLSLKNYVQNTLKMEEPIVLAEKASGGLTIIEKFEKFSEECNLIFVLLTPDDIYSEDNKNRARQNVIFEMGYFLGKLGRKSGRVILLYKGNLELPNDISGLVYINIDNGIEAAGEQIRREIAEIDKML